MNMSNKILNDKEFHFLSQLFGLSQTQIREFLASHLKKKGYTQIYMTKDYLYAVGDMPIALVAHMDVIYTGREEVQVFYDPRHNVLWSPQGLGADDRAGIYAILKILQRGFKPTLIFTTEEETGGVGARKFIQDYPQPLTKLKYIVELDRQGSSDCVFYDCNNENFTEYIQSFGFVRNWGTYTDICEICPKWKIAGVNLSIGYLQEHSLGEHLRVSWMNITIKKLIKLLEDVQNAEFYSYIYSNRYNYTTVNKDYDTTGTLYQCSKCKRYFDEADTISIIYADKTEHRHCLDCLDGGIEWCDLCDTMYIKEKDSKEHNICPRCKEIKDKWKK